jgi:Nucleotide modification associated domain 2
MKLSAYIVRVDSGFAPNPFGHHCTLACCKPTIRRKAEPGDIIVGGVRALRSRGSTRLCNAGP